MSLLIRIAFVIVFVALGGLACGSSGARAEESQNAARDFLKGLSKAVAKQTFTGTVVVTDTAAGEVVTDDQVIGKSTTKTQLNSSVTLTVTTNGVVANVTYSSKSVFEQELRYQYHKVVGTKTEETTASGHSDNGTVTVDLRADGSYQINFSGGGVVGEYRMSDTAETICTNLAADPTCRPGTTSSSDAGKPPSQGGVGGSVDGRIDKKQPNVLVGSVTQRHELNDGSTATRTVTWNLSRSQP
jgi:hypothetical protein